MIIIARTRFVPPDEMDCILMALLPTNRLVARVCLACGLRVSDCLSITTDKLRQALTSGSTNVHMRITESKTGKTRVISLPRVLAEEMLSQAGTVYVFEGRCNPSKHRTRQAVFKDMRRVAAALRIAPVSPHSTRKCFAVRKYHSTGSLSAVRKALCHSNDIVTALYALADQLPVNKPKRISH